MSKISTASTATSMRTGTVPSRWMSLQHGGSTIRAQAQLPRRYDADPLQSAIGKNQFTNPHLQNSEQRRTHTQVVTRVEDFGKATKKMSKKERAAMREKMWIEQLRISGISK
jgi:hypothetical protein